MRYEVVLRKNTNLILKVIKDNNEVLERGYMKSILEEIGIEGEIAYFKWYGDIKTDNEAVLILDIG